MLKSDNYSTQCPSNAPKFGQSETKLRSIVKKWTQNTIISQSHTNYTVHNFVFYKNNFYSINHLWFRFDETSFSAAWISLFVSFGSRNSIGGVEMNTAIIFSLFYWLFCYDNNDIIWFYDDGNEEQRNVNKKSIVLQLWKHLKSLSD